MGKVIAILILRKTSRKTKARRVNSRSAPGKLVQSIIEYFLLTLLQPLISRKKKREKIVFEYPGQS